MPIDDHDPQLKEIIAKYLKAIELGGEPSREQLLSQHPDHAADLGEFFKRFDQAGQSVQCDDETLLAGETKREGLSLLHTAAGGVDDTVASEHAPGCEPTEQRTADSTESERESDATVKHFGDYELLEEIARGGMGVVFKARQTKLNRIVALKMILAGQLASPADVQRFHAEAEAAANLTHSGIVPIYEVGEHDGQHFFSMGFIEGKSLADKIKDGPLAPRTAAEYVRRVAEAIAFAHASGVIHRDLKPANVLVDRDGTPKVTDFGLAKHVEGDSGLTATGQILGTPSYMPPEQAAGKISEITEAADVYSLGAVLYCLIVGRPPFQAASSVDTLLQVLEKEPLSPRQLNPSVPTDLATICLKCLEKDPGKRYPSAGELNDELTRFLNGEPIVARPISRPVRLWRWCKRKPVVAGLTAALSMAVLIGLVSVSILWGRSEVARLDAETANAEAQENLYQSLLREAEAVRRVRESGYQARVWSRLRDAVTVPVAEVDHAKIRQEAVACLGDFVGVEPITIRGSVLVDSPSRCVFLDDERLACALADGSITIRDVTTGDELATLHRPGSTVFSIDTCFDGKTIIAGDAKCLERWDALPNGMWEAKWRLPARFTAARRFSLFGNGARVAFASAASVSIADTESGKIVNRLSKEANLIPFVSVAASPDGKYIAAARTQPVTITVWRSEDNEVLAEFQPPTTGNPTVAFSPDGQYMVLGSDQGFITYRTSDFSQWSLSRMDNIRDISFSPDGRFLLFPTVTSKVQMWSMATQRRVAELSHPSVMIGSGSTGFSPTGKRFFSIGGDVIRIWTMAGLPEKVVTGGHSQGVPQIAFHPRDPILASGSKDGTIRFWNSRDGSQLKMIDIQEPVESIAYSHDGKMLAVGTSTKRPIPRFWQTDELVEIPIRFEQEPSPEKSVVRINGVRFSSDGKWFAFTGSRGTQVWQIHRDEAADTVSFSGARLSTIYGKFAVFDTSSRFLAVTAQSKFHLWDLSVPPGSSKEHSILPIQLVTGWHNLASDPEKAVLYGVTRDGILEGWDIKSRKAVSTIRNARPFQAYHIAASPTTSLLAVDASPSAATLFYLPNGARLFELGEENAPIWGLAWDPSGHQLALSLSDGGVVIWRIDEIIRKLQASGLAQGLDSSHGISLKAETARPMVDVVFNQDWKSWDYAEPSAESDRLGQIFHSLGTLPQEDSAELTADVQLPEETLATLLESMGFVTTWGAFALTIPAHQFAGVSDELHKLGYQIRSMRPFEEKGELRLAACWEKDNLEATYRMDVTRQELLETHEEMSDGGYRILDVGGYYAASSSERAELFYGVWRRVAGEFPDQKIGIGIDSRARARMFQDLRDTCRPLSRQVYFTPVNEPRFCEIWDNADQENRGPWAAFVGDPATMENRFRQHAQVPPRYIDMGSTLDGSEPKIAAVWRAFPDGRDTREMHGIPVATMYTVGKVLLQNGYVPISMCVSSGDSGPPLGASVWEVPASETR